MGSIAYKLALPPHSKIHNVFHCSLLKLHEGPPPSLIDQLPPLSLDNHPLLTPLAILDFQTKLENGTQVQMALVQWHGLSPDDTSWENWDELKTLYNLEDKVGFDGGSIVMSKPNGTKDKGVMDPSSAKEAASVQARPKREVIPPRKWSDFVIYK